MISVMCDLIQSNFFCYYKIQILKWSAGTFADQRNKTYCNTIKKKNMSKIFQQLLTSTQPIPDIVVYISYI